MFYNYLLYKLNSKGIVCLINGCGAATTNLLL